jgi:DNA-binding Lrp family transcriptional regulator
MIERGLIRRIGAVPNHYRLGYCANGMSVWDVDDARVDELGERIGRLPGVTHCYRRTRSRPEWPYNLFVMLHGRSRAEVERQADIVAGLLGGACRARNILYSTKMLKKTGLRLAMPSLTTPEAPAAPPPRGGATRGPAKPDPRWHAKEIVSKDH